MKFCPSKYISCFCCLCLWGSTVLQGQTDTFKVAITAGATISTLNYSPSLKTSPAYVVSFSFRIEPTILSFGEKRQFDFNLGCSFFQNGATINYNYSLPSEAPPYYTIDNEMIELRNIYISVSPIVKYNFLRWIYVKAGFNMNIFDTYSINNSLPPIVDGNNYKFATLGVSYGFGLNFGENSNKFVIDFLGQNDFTTAYKDKLSGQTFKNECFAITLGVIRKFKE